MRDQVTHYLDRARMAARVGVIGRVTQVAPVIEPLVRALERIHQEQGRRHQRRLPAGRALLRREAGPGGDARQPARQRLQVGAPRGGADGRAAAVDQPRRAAAGSPSPSMTTARASTTSSAHASASGACGSTRRSPAPGSGCRSSSSWPTPTAARAELAQAPQGGLAVRLKLPAG